MSARKWTYSLSFLIIALALVASAIGILFNEVYQDTELIKSAWFGSDIITLLVVIPVLILSILQAKKSYQAYLIWMGLLAYMIYNYAFYLFGAAFNKLFLLYVAIFSLSIYAFVLGLSDINIDSIKQITLKRVLSRGTSVFQLFISLPLAAVELGMCINSWISGKLPQAPHLIFALDLSLIVPNSALAAILLWKNKPWGYILSIIMLVKAFTYGAGLTISTIYVASKGSYDPLLPFYVFITIGGVIFLFLLLSTQPIYEGATSTTKTRA